MAATCALFEGLDLLDLWHLYGHIGRAADVRGISISKVSRRTHDLLRELGIRAEQQRGAPDPAICQQSQSLGLMRLAYQHWRLEQRCPKVLPTFTTTSVLRGDSQLDVLQDVFLSAAGIRDHLLQRRVDLVVSSTLDLAGEIIEQSQAEPTSPFLSIPLFADPLLLGVNPDHGLAGSSAAAPEDCRDCPSPAYPDGIARRAAKALRARGLWRFPSKRRHFDAAEWMQGMRSASGLCYVSALFLEAVPESRDLALVPFSDPLQQTTTVLMLKEIANSSGISQAVEEIRKANTVALARLDYEATLLD